MAGDLWIESHAELKDHPKLARLVKELRTPAVKAVGHLHFLWWWAARFADDGATASWDDVDIALGAGWTGDPAAFVSALKSSGFMDQDGRLHDWTAYFKVKSRRDSARIRQANHREKQKGHSDKRKRNRDITVTSRPVTPLPDLTRPDQTGQDQTNPSQASACAPADTTVAKVPDPAKALLDHHCANYLKRVGEKYPVSGQKDMALCRKLIANYGLPKACELSDQMFRSLDDFVRGSGYTFGAFFGCASKLVIEYNKEHPKPRADVPRLCPPVKADPPRLTEAQNAEKAKAIRDLIEKAKLKELPDA